MRRVCCAASSQAAHIRSNEGNVLNLWKKTAKLKLKIAPRLPFLVIHKRQDIMTDSQGVLNSRYVHGSRKDLCIASTIRSIQGFN